RSWPARRAGTLDPVARAAGGGTAIALIVHRHHRGHRHGRLAAGRLTARRLTAQLRLAESVVRRGGRQARRRLARVRRTGDGASGRQPPDLRRAVAGKRDRHRLEPVAVVRRRLPEHAVALVRLADGTGVVRGEVARQAGPGPGAVPVTLARYVVGGHGQGDRRGVDVLARHRQRNRRRHGRGGRVLRPGRVIRGRAVLQRGAVVDRGRLVGRGSVLDG